MKIAATILFLFFLSIEMKAQDRLPVKILTWNIYMRPASLFWNGQFKRAKAIGEILKKEDYDLILFQEAFGKTSRKKLKKALGNASPFQIEPQKRGCKSNTGLWVLSKHKISDSEIIFFNNCKRGDCLAAKGAVLIEVEMNKQHYQFINTHTQAEYGKKRKIRFTNVRQMQFEQINTLLSNNVLQQTPQFILGDLNTDKTLAKDHQQMLKILNATDSEPLLFGSAAQTLNTPATWHASTNDLIAKKKDGISELLDYALQRNSNYQFKVRRELKIYEQKRSKSHSDLSDHYAISLTIYP